MDQWIFYTDLFGRFQWLRQTQHGRQLDQSDSAFDTALACVQNAIQHGLPPEAAHNCPVPGVVHTPSEKEPASQTH